MKLLKTHIFSILAAILLTGAAFVPADGQTYSGRAQGAVATYPGPNGAPTTAVFADTGDLNPGGGVNTTTVQRSWSAGFFQTGLLYATTTGAINASLSSSTVEDVIITIGANTIRARRVIANTVCICCPGFDIGSCSGNTQIDGLTITDGTGATQTVAVTGQPNQTVNFAGGTLVINEQFPGPGTITVNGLRVTSTDGSRNLVLARVHSDLDCIRTNPTPGDVTVSGRVLTRTGIAVKGATVTLTDLDGNSRSVQTNTYGRFSFETVTAGRNYVISASHRSYTFNPVTVTADDDVVVDITAN